MHSVPESFQKFDALRWLIITFWDRSRTVVATWLTKYYIQFLAVHFNYAFAKPANRISTREGIMVVEQQVG